MEENAFQICRWTTVMPCFDLMADVAEKSGGQSHGALSRLARLRATLPAPMRLTLLFAVLSSVFAQDWPSFRGPSASGTADRQNLPLTWDAASGANIRWKTPVPGLAHSSPVVAGNRIFVTTAISTDPNATFKPGLYGAGTASEDTSVQRMKLLCYDLRTGKLLWEHTAFEGVPKEKRHIKSTYANATPATDGNIVVAFFGSHGVYALTVKGKPLWQRDLGRMDAGAYDAPDYEWGTASSPILYQNLVIIQADQQKASFLIALDKKSGKTVWRTERDELPSWGTPTVYTGKPRPELITNGSNFIRGYDPETGRELWRLGGSSKITAPTPVFRDNLIVVSSGRRPEAPIFAILAGASGEIKPGTPHLAWHRNQRGSYMPTPLIYGDYLYVLNNSGVFDCYRLGTGEDVYRERIPHSGSGFSASPVASDGRIYLSSEDGQIVTVKAGAAPEVLSKHEMGEPIMATPAIVNGVLLVRGQHHLWAISAPGQPR